MLNIKKALTELSEKLHDSYTLYGSGNMVIIPNNSDMNSYTDEGLYCIPTASAAQTMSHYPTTTGGRLEVFNILRYSSSSDASGKRLYQRLYTNGGNCDIYYRFWNGSSWYAWRLVTTTAVGGG